MARQRVNQHREKIHVDRAVRVGGERAQLDEPMAQELQTPFEGEASRTSLSAAELSLQVPGNYPGRVCLWKGFVGSLRCKDTKGMGRRIRHWACLFTTESTSL